MKSVTRFFLVSTIYFLLCLPFLSMASDQKIPTQSDQEQDSALMKPKVAAFCIFEDFDFWKIVQNLVSAAKNTEIAGILLFIDNYGGRSNLFSMLHDTIKKINSIKPVVSVVIGAAQSGGYLIASATSHIVAHSCSSIGSIGAVLEISRYKDPKITVATEAKLKTELFRAGEFKDLFNPYLKELSDRERKYINGELDKNYKHFLTTVVCDRSNKSLRLENYKEWAEGKIFIAEEALALGLIDEIGTIFDAEKKMLELIVQTNQNYSKAQQFEYISYNENQNNTSKN